MLLILKNKKAFFNYEIKKTYETGIILKGSEVKAIKKKKMNLDDSYVTIQQNELFIVKMHVSIINSSSLLAHDPLRKKKLLVHKKEIIKIKNLIKLKGYTIIPLKIYIKKNLIKLEIGVAIGKKKFDKRLALKEKDIKRKIRTFV